MGRNFLFLQNRVEFILRYAFVCEEFMVKNGLRIACFCLLSVALASICYGQAAGSARMPPDYGGVNVRIAGVFVTPVPNAPFSATVDIVSKQKLPDGSLNVRTTVAHIARDSAGRIYNERRALVSAAFRGEPTLLSAHIYDPTTHLNTFLDPFSHLARQSVFVQARQTAAIDPTLGPHAGGMLTKQEELGEQTIGNTLLRGIKKVWTVPATMSGTGAAVEIVDQYWYSPDLSVYLIVQHDDPRTGEQIVAVKDVNRAEPDTSVFAVPARYRIVDENPAP
jgi:hypothetical protein